MVPYAYSTKYWVEEKGRIRIDFFCPIFVFTTALKSKTDFQFEFSPTLGPTTPTTLLNCISRKSTVTSPRLTVTITKMILKIDSDVLLKNEKYLRNQKNILVSISECFPL